MKEKLIKLTKQVRALFPEKLPVGMTAFNEWVDSFVTLYDLPTKDMDSIRFTLATIIINLKPTNAFKSKFYFYLILNAAAAKQVAGSVFHETKQKQLDAAKKAAAEATAQTVVASNGTQH